MKMARIQVVMLAFACSASHSIVGRQMTARKGDSDSEHDNCEHDYSEHDGNDEELRP